MLDFHVLPCIETLDLSHNVIIILKNVDFDRHVDVLHEYSVKSNERVENKATSRINMLKQRCGSQRAID